MEFDPEVEVGVFFDFDLVIFHTLIGIENSRNQGKCEVVLEQLSVFIRKCGWDFPDGRSEILQVSNPAKGALKKVSSVLHRTIRVRHFQALGTWTTLQIVKQ